MSENYSKRKRFDPRYENKNGNSSGGSVKKFKTSDRDYFRFSSRRAEYWPLFLQKHETELMEEGIDVSSIQSKLPRLKLRLRGLHSERS